MDKDNLGKLVNVGDLADELKALQAENKSLKAEVERLKDILTARHIKFSPNPVSIEEIASMIHAHNLSLCLSSNTFIYTKDADGIIAWLDKSNESTARSLHDRIYGKGEEFKKNLDAWQEQLRGGLDKPKEYCDCIEKWGSYCAKCKGLLKPIKTERIRKLSIYREDGEVNEIYAKHLDFVVADFGDKINELIEYINQKWV